METEKPYKEGYLLFPPHGVLGQLKKSWHRKYCQLFKASKHGIERLEVFDSEDDASKNSSVRIITLENCIKITQDAQKHQANVFAIVTKTAVYHFASLAEKEMAEWIAAFQSTAFKDDCSRTTIEEDNDLYCSSGEGVFLVKLVPSEASTRCGLEPGPYTLVIASAAIQLRDNDHHHLLFTWPYRYIRRYGYREGKFIFEAGRKCDTGEGTFHLEHSNQQEIFRCISSKMKSMRKLLNGEMHSMPAIICGDNQFQAALSMEARSRSPLPPSPTSATPLVDLDFSAMQHMSFKSLVPMSTESKHSAPPLIKPKPRPSKPPRKSLGGIPLSKSIRSSSDGSVLEYGKYRRLKSSDSLGASTASTISPSSINKPEHHFAYDIVEVRKNAWQTMGINDMKHSERDGSDTEEESNYMTPIAQDTSNPVPLQCSKILVTQMSSKESMEDYDKLQYLGSSARTNGNSPGYRVIALNSSGVSAFAEKSAAPPIDYRHYDDIGIQMQACRMADDSHNGYGMIRKKSTPAAQNDLGPNHELYNEMEYAIVQKPKRV